MKDLRLFEVKIRNDWESEDSDKEATIAAKDIVSALNLAIRWQNVCWGRGTYDLKSVISVEENVGCKAVVE